MYLITDEVNVANYAFVLVDPSGAAKAKIAQIDGSNLTTSELQNNFINGFEFPVKGGLGVFRFSITHPTGTDPVTGNPASYILQAYGTGPINDTPNYSVVAKRAALKFNVVAGGVVHQTVNLPAVAAIPSPAGGKFHHEPVRPGVRLLFRRYGGGDHRGGLESGFVFTDAQPDPDGIGE